MPRVEAVLAPDIRRQRGEVASEPRAVLNEATGRVTGTVRGHVVSDQLHRLWRRKEITTLQFEAGRCLQSDAELSQATIPSLLDPRRIRGGGNIDIVTYAQGERAAAASIRLRCAVARLGPCVAVTLAVVVQGLPAGHWARANGKAERDGIASLRLGLDALISYYRIDGEP